MRGMTLPGDRDGERRTGRKQRRSGTIGLESDAEHRTRCGAMPEVQTDLRIHYRVVGDGPPLLWHTGGCGDGQMWQLAGYLDGLPGYTHLVMDHRGRGRSESPQDLAGHHMSRYVADAMAVLDDAGMDRVGFVGYSFGARVGFAIAVSAPGRLAGLVALDSFPGPAASPEAVRAAGERGADSWHSGGDRRFRCGRAGAGARVACPAPVRDGCSGVRRWHRGRGHRAALLAGGPLRGRASAPRTGRRGRARRARLGRQLVQDLKYAELVTLDVAHLAVFHRTDLTLPLLERFLASVSPPR